MGLFSSAMLDAVIFMSDLSLLGSFVSLFLQVKNRRSATGISLQTVAAVAASRCLHLISHPTSLHFVPMSLPIGLFYLMDYLNAFVGLGVLFYIMTNHISTYESEKDNFSHKFLSKWITDQSVVRSLRYVFIYVVAGLFGFVWYLVRRSQHTFILSYFCCYYEAICAVALLPQLWMFQQDKVVSPQLANFVVAIGCNRFFTLIFWLSYPYVYPNRYPDNRGVQMTSEILNLLILSDFLYYYIKAKIRGDKIIVIPTAMNAV
jgi:hypothetical protein